MLTKSIFANCLPIKRDHLFKKKIRFLKSVLITKSSLKFKYNYLFK